MFSILIKNNNRRKDSTEDHKEILGGDGYDSALVVVKLSIVYAYVQTQQSVNIKCVQLLYIRYASIK